MFELLFPYLSGTIATAIAMVVATLAYLRHNGAAKRYALLESRLPDACRWQNIQVLREQGQQELDALRDQVQDARILLAQRADAEHWITENQSQLLALRAEREEQERIRLELVQLSKRLEHDRNRQLILAKEAQQAEIACDALRQQEKHAAGAIRDLETQRQALAAEVRELEKTCIPLRRELTGLQSEVAAINAEIKTARLRLERELKAANDQFERERKDAAALLEKSLNGFQKLARQAEQQKDQVVAELKAVEEQVAKERRQYDTLQAQKGVLNAEVAGLKAENVSLKKQNDLLRDDWQQLRIKTGQDDETERQRTAELWQPAIARVTSSFQSVRDQDELSCLERAQSHLKHLGLQFPQRVLWAFHTSLKVTDISPLVVLAGISGTGKSELPRRYSEAMGLHFLNVAVQPRWDSPQDMFGFYNYLEGRYRATDLGRALIQMDPFHTEAGRGWRAPDNWKKHSLSPHLLLVLLDEMNLARVEYYFSEFLSKLEIRRGIRRDDPQDRRKAELGLEIGSSGNLSPVMNIFVDRNVLFVGTMNEDETTQTLSDKVVDRANVLRFGRPGRIDRNVVHVNGGAVNERLPFSTWQSWCRGEADLPTETANQVDEWINRLNDALTRIRRPFAFRTQLAIKSYVVNYPSHDPDAVLQAMSDQVEQKILPKLRGFDSRDKEFQQTVRDVQSVLRELKDDLLVDAIQNALKGHQFTWMGVDRLREQFVETVAE